MNLSRFDWALCRSFLALLREGSLSGAARALDLAHPTLRRHLETIEGAIGAPLFVRSTTGLVPTDLALSLRGSAESMEAAAEAFLRDATLDATTVSGTVRITASEVMGAEVLPAILARIKAEHPGLVFELILTNAVENLARHDADLAVRMTQPQGGDLVARKIGAVPIGLFAHRDWLSAHRMPASFEALVAARGLIGYDRDPLLVRALTARGIQVERSDFGFRADSDLAQLAALRNGIGVGVCQVPLAARDPALCRVLPAFTEALGIWLVTAPSLRGVLRLRIVTAAVADGLKAYLQLENPKAAN